MGEVVVGELMVLVVTVEVGVVAVVAVQVKNVK